MKNGLDRGKNQEGEIIKRLLIVVPVRDYGGLDQDRGCGDMDD